MTSCELMPLYKLKADSMCNKIPLYNLMMAVETNVRDQAFSVLQCSTEMHEVASVYRVRIESVLLCWDPLVNARHVGTVALNDQHSLPSCGA